MKNEVMARAMNHIDDELIIAAHEYKKRKFQGKHWTSFVAMAASFFVLFSVTWMFGRNAELDVLLYGEHITEKAVAVELPMRSSSVSRPGNVIPSNITVPLEMNSSKEIHVEALDGTMEAYSVKTNQSLYEGHSYVGSEPVMIYWTIDQPKMDQTYRLLLKEDKKVISLTYDNDMKQWIVIKEKSN